MIKGNCKVLSLKKMIMMMHLMVKGQNVCRDITMKSGVRGGGLLANARNLQNIKVWHKDLKLGDDLM